MKGSGANHYPRAPARLHRQTDYKRRNAILYQISHQLSTVFHEILQTLLSSLIPRALEIAQFLVGRSFIDGL